MPKQERRHIVSVVLTGLLCLVNLLLLSACSPTERGKVDELNGISYAFHYVSLDSTELYARKAFRLADNQRLHDAQAEALNNLAFVNIARMQYAEAKHQLDSIPQITDNQIELLVAAIQQMRLCQRESRNKEFYEFYEQAKRALSRIDEDHNRLSERQSKRMVYARSELACVVSTYYYYVGLEQNSSEELLRINVREVEQDTAQYLNYLYQVGAGGIIQAATRQEVAQQEWDYLVYCYQLAQTAGNVYWKANSMQALSEHLTDEEVGRQLMADNQPTVQMVNVENVPDSLLAGYLAEKSLELFMEYGDVYQVAGSYRTLASCYWTLGDYNASGYYLEKALADTMIYQAPDLVASIREKLSLTYSAIDDKPRSDENRSIYIDLQEQTRQDRQLEARADRLARNGVQLNFMIAAVVMMIAAVVFSIFLFDYLRRRKARKNPIEKLLEPLKEWERDNTMFLNDLNEKYEEVNEACSMSRLYIQNNKRRNVENRAKVFLVNSVTPLIDRMTNEVSCLMNRQETPDVRTGRYHYIAEITEKINEYNAVLTEWIQLQQGQLSLKIETFRLQDVFNIVARSRMAFQLRDIELVVEPTDDVVKADRILTLFMINTMADNARKFTPKGGRVVVSSQQADDYVEIAIEDNGEGMDEAQLSGLFDHKVKGGHGFGLMNCKGIIEKYRKTSQLFRVCTIQAESRKGEGSRFSFRLPKGVAHTVRTMVTLLMVLTLGSSPFSASAQSSQPSKLLTEAMAYADSTYQCNLDGRYQQAMFYADNAWQCIVSDVALKYEQQQVDVVQQESAEPLELQWYHQGIDTDYDLIVFLRNEIAVAALALHQWDVYQQNNRIYTLLYKEKSADKRLGDYVQTMQRQETNKTIAVALLVLLLVAIVVAYYMLYERHRIYFRSCVEQVERINEMLLSEMTAEQKLSALDASISPSAMPDQLQHIVGQIKDALQRAVETERSQQLSIELAGDELRRAEYENQKLHVSNNVLDNCLSALKHETMYYPSRIRQLIDGTDNNLPAIQELLAYYKDLYTMLSAQAMRQIDEVRPESRKVQLADVLGTQIAYTDTGQQVMGDETMLSYLFELLVRQSGQQKLSATVSQRSNSYVDVRLPMTSLPYRDFFVPSMQNVPLLICRQILRDNSEATNLRGCGIVAEQQADGSTVFRVIMPALSPLPINRSESQSIP